MQSEVHPHISQVPRQTDRLVGHMARAVTRCALDLQGRLVVTEAATGPYVSTAVMAAMAGARVVALARATRYGTVDEVRAWTAEVAESAGVGDAVRVVEALSPEALRQADLVTNSGHLRPLDAALVERLNPAAVVPLMMESWEIGAGRADVDLQALRRRGIAFAGTNERHPAVGVFDYLGVMAVKLLVDAGVAVHGCRIVLLCDNPFREYLERTLRACGARVTVLGSTEDLVTTPVADAVVVSLRPAAGPRLRRTDLEVLQARMPDVVVAQFFGDVDRGAAEELDIHCWPAQAPPHGHMGILPSDIGPEPIVRLQAGGLKVGQVLLTPEARRSAADQEFLDAV